MELPALLKYVNRRRGAQSDPISEDDVVRFATLKILLQCPAKWSQSLPRCNGLPGYNATCLISCKS